MKNDKLKQAAENVLKWWDKIKHATIKIGEDEDNLFDGEPKEIAELRKAVADPRPTEKGK